MSRHRLLVGIIAVQLLCPTQFLFADDVEQTKRFADGDNRKQYLLVGENSGNGKAGLLLVLPGGDGSEEFAPFVKRIHENSCPSDMLLAQLVAVKWTPEQEVVWPTKANKPSEAAFTTEQFVASVITDLEKDHSIDRARVALLSWSSSGPAAYAAVLQKESPVRRAMIAMSVFKPERASLAFAKDKRVYLYHSRQDKICPFRFAEQAQSTLEKQDAKVKLVEYDGGHGWHGDVFGSIKEGLKWLDEAHEQ